ncbi:MAG TPA: C4-dicarboxylate transporter DcuC [Bacteroidales bacterium]|nr:MAG: putative cryptic C4-dicarboxylate transporter DcuD [Bacteroidetes bacterium ADurb.BinA104]HQK71740.1 C4-dicarboxylate transporter DcuC [Bacteroidales bacterium]
MVFIGGLIALHVVLLTAFLLYRRYNASFTLLVMGMVMYFISRLLAMPGSEIPEGGTGFILFDFFKFLIDSFINRFGSTGLLIMLIGGYVEFMRKIKANDALIFVMMQPLSIVKQYPYLAAIMIIPIGQILFISISSAVALGLLLIATVYPVLVGLGVSRLTAVSVITACTVFDMGPTSSNAAMASELISSDTILYFTSQLRVTLPLIIVMMALLLISNKYFDRRDLQVPNRMARVLNIEELVKTTPLYYALFPALPLIFTVLFAPSINIFNLGITLDIAPLIILSMFIAVIAELIRRKSVKDTFAAINPFWVGAGRVFTSVIVLIVCAEIFASGLISLGLIDSMVTAIQALGLNSVFVTLLLTLISFSASLITGSGVASFTTIGQLIPDLALKFGIPSITFMIPVQLAAGLGRAASPIAIVIIAVSEIAGVSPFDIAKRNAGPLLSISLLLVLLSYILL